MVTPVNIAWAAGFIEGEGSFAFRRKKNSLTGTAAISAVQKQRAPLDRLVLYFGGNIYVRRNRTAFGDSPISVWEITGPKAIALMMTLYAHMSPWRRVQIQKAITHWRSLPGRGVHHREKTHCPKGHPYDQFMERLRKNGERTVHRKCRACYVEYMRVYMRSYTRGERRRLRVVPAS